MGITLPEQLDWLDQAREAEADLGFLGRMLALCSLPRTDQGKRSQFVRINGPFSLAMSAGATGKLPYGNLPRLLLAWVSTEAVRTGRRELVLGKSLRHFMGHLGINNDGGVPRRRLRDQMERLFSCAISLHYRGDAKSIHLAGVIAEKAVFWWDYDRPDMDTLFPSEIRLSQPFFDSIVRQPIPINLNCLHALRRSSLGLDLYLWLTYRTFSLTQPLALTWKQLYIQHGPFPEKAGDNVTVQNFRKKCLRELKKIKLAWPDLHYTTERGRLILHPTPPQIPAKRDPDAYA